MRHELDHAVIALLQNLKSFSDLADRLMVIAVGYDMLSVELREKASGDDVRLMILSGSKS